MSPHAWVSIDGCGMNDVQQLADNLADRLNRSIEIDDCSLRPLALTEQYGDLDDVRVQAILRRHSTPEVFDHAFSLDIAHATGPVRYPPDSALKTLARVCIPLRAHGELQGYLWLIDSPPLTDSDITVAVETATDIADLLHHYAQATANAIEREAQTVSAVLTLPTHVEPSIDLVREQPLLSFAESLTVISTRLHLGQDAAEPLHHRAVRSAAYEVGYARPLGHSLLGHTEDTIQLIAGSDIHPDRLRPFRHALAKAAERRGWVLYGTGIGGAASD
ncbi:MAG: GAF domain-containing protein, partial [Rhodococcus sp. (in: high G+C Gram-positive bacteria)]